MRIVMDWKHFVMEDHDHYLFAEDGLSTMDPVKGPDVLVVSLGIHPCFHTTGAAFSSVNETRQNEWIA